MNEILSHYALDGRPIHWARYGSGHINETYLVVTTRPHLYILQRINTRIFPDAEGLMRNIVLVTEHIRQKESDPRRVLTLVRTREGSWFVRRGEEIWRLYEFVTGSICLDQAETLEDFRQSGVAFGQFQRQLADFPADRLTEVLPGFHDTPRRYENLRRAIEADAMGRAKTAQAEIEGYLERAESAGKLTGLLEEGALPLRVTHNDTKLNNVMLDEGSRQPLCVIDLDTVMPGLAAYDFGDSIRFGASTAAEDETDLSQVRLSLPHFRAFTQGFLSMCGASLTLLEKQTLPDGARLMTLECGARFLTDYLEGDHYFHTARPGHNLDRARTQLKLVREMEAHWEEMAEIVGEYG
ncbi:MAG: aminoglycoside phosphotransferase family protein [Clostridia bacterium]|nr:aminoglycoside phosphotransferase family protein [Clostridia bacterium]